MVGVVFILWLISTAIILSIFYKIGKIKSKFDEDLERINLTNDFNIEIEELDVMDV